MIWQTIRRQYQLIFGKGANARNSNNRIQLEEKTENTDIPQKRKGCCGACSKTNQTSEKTTKEIS